MSIPGWRIKIISRLIILRGLVHFIASFVPSVQLALSKSQLNNKICVINLAYKLEDRHTLNIEITVQQ